MSHTMKIMERIIERRLREETTIGDEQFGFMPGRGTTDAIFVLRKLMEKHRENPKGLHMVFIDLDRVKHTIVCLVKKFGDALGRRECMRHM